MEAMMSQVSRAWVLCRWEACRGARALASKQLVWTVALGLSAGLNAGLLYWSDARQTEVTLTDQATQRVHDTASKKALRQPTPQAWATFDAVLVPADRVSNVLHDMLETAQSQKVEILAGEYSEHQDKDGGFWRYEVNMPLRGTARDLRRFIETVLNAQPSLAVRGVQFKRERLADAQVEARVRWVIFCRDRAAEGPLQ